MDNDEELDGELLIGLTDRERKTVYLALKLFQSRTIADFPEWAVDFWREDCKPLTGDGLVQLIVKVQ